MVGQGRTGQGRYRPSGSYGSLGLIWGMVGTTDFKSWCCSNDMHIHKHETLLIMLGSRQNLSINDLLQIILDNELIKNVENQKLLGIIID